LKGITVEIVKKKKVARKLKTPDKAMVVGISGSPAFWKAVDRYAKKIGTTRSASVVRAVAEHLGINPLKVANKAPGRRKKTVRKAVKK
jgi:hypothetical protein